ncbi:hypothetical protein FACS1894172_07300 [Spirochaetia bacterium]|nr:hypothetical protein FACS1894164_21440 [Spirochaetia bacterium]GHU31799.1 hypothetical protein FACS1894172_07300 [Spirochaetia bacterium]
MIDQAGGCIFDLDGTLYDSSGFALHLIAEQPFEAFLLLAERKTRKSLAGSDYGQAESYYREFFSRLSQAAGKPEQLLRKWYFESYMPRMCRVLNKYYRPRSHLNELFGHLLKNDFKFSVYSDYPFVMQRLHALGLPVEGYRFYSPEDFGAQKPALRPFLSIADAMHVVPGETLVVGDRDDTDGAGAAAAGMGFFRIKTDGDWGSFCSYIHSKLEKL